MPNSPGLSRREAARLHVLPDIRYAAPPAPATSAYERASHRRPVREQALCRHIQRGGDHLRFARRRGRVALPLGRSCRPRRYLDVRRDPEDTAADLALKPVHHRQHRDQRGDAERDADHRHRRNERDRAVALPGARVTQPDIEFLGRQAGLCRKRLFSTHRRHVSCDDADSHGALHTAAMNCHLLVPDLFHAALAGLMASSRCRRSRRCSRAEDRAGAARDPCSSAGPAADVSHRCPTRSSARGVEPGGRGGRPGRLLLVAGRSRSFQHPARPVAAHGQGPCTACCRRRRASS